ncbi:MAG TPA: hypothetical protein VGR19_09800 [Allosphingosinicella sp.]|nr:hypothetical protein [Allosphingosinicella sp.]
MEIPVEKKSSMSWLWILLALLLAALLLWWLLDDDDEAAEPVAVGTVATAPADLEAGQVAPLPEPVAQVSGRSIGDILGNPSAFVGQPFSQDSVEVASVPTDRGFWIRDNGQQMFAIMTGEGESKLDINPGQRVRIKEGMLRDATFLQQGQIPGNLDKDTRSVIEGQKVFLALEAGDVEILSRPGSDGKAPAQ